MRVELNGLGPVQSPVERSPRQVPADRPVDTGRIFADRTTFASDGPTVQPLVRQALSAPAVRQEKVEAIRQSIASGSYKVDLESIAAGIVSESAR